MYVTAVSGIGKPVQELAGSAGLVKPWGWWRVLCLTSGRKLHLAGSLLAGLPACGRGQRV